VTFVVISDFFSAYSQSIDSAVFRRVLTATATSAKSSNAVTRAGAIQLFKTAISKINASSDLKLALDELLALPRSGKTAGADHRVALYAMLGCLPPSQDVSPTVAEIGPSLLSKETHDGAILVLAPSLVRHVAFCLQQNIALPAGVQSSIAKDMNAAKPSVRRAFSSLAGNVLWQLGDLSTPAALDFAKAILSSLEVSLKVVAASPAAPPAGPLEGYIAVALLLGPYHQSGKFGRSVVFYPGEHISEFTFCGCFFVCFILQRTPLIEIQLCNHCLQAARSHHSCCGRKSTRSSPNQKIKYGCFVLVKQSWRSTRTRL
jgi:hypothetical protein